MEAVDSLLFVLASRLTAGDFVIFPAERFHYRLDWKFTEEIRRDKIQE